GERERAPLVEGLGAAQPARRLGETRRILGILAVRAIRGRRDELGSDQQRELDVGRILAPREIVPKGQEPVGPRGDRVLVAAERLDAEPAAPAVVSERLHRRLAPLALARSAIPEPAGDLVVAVGERIRLDDDVVADDPLHREAPAIDLRAHGFDHDAAAPVLDDHAGSFGCLNTTTASGGSVMVSEW